MRERERIRRRIIRRKSIPDQLLREKCSETSQEW
jgi:hypothetical protein